MATWISNEQIGTFACELITNEYLNRIEERVLYLHNTYDKDSSIGLVDRILDVLFHCRSIIDTMIVYDEEEPKLSDYLEEQKYYRDKFKKMKDGTYIPVPKSQEEIKHLHHTFRIPKLELVRNYISTSGDINWIEMNDIINRVHRTKKVIFENDDKIITQKKNNNDTNKQIESLDELFNNNALQYVNILKKVMAENNKYSIGDDNSWNKKKDDMSIIIAWIDVLEYKRKLKNNSLNRKILSTLLNKYFLGLNLNESDSSMWNKPTKVYGEYKQKFMNEIK